jgi:hypothetical protein
VPSGAFWSAHPPTEVSVCVTSSDTLELFDHFSNQALDAQVILFHQSVLAQFLRRQGFTVFLLCHGANLVQFYCAWYQFS